MRSKHPLFSVPGMAWVQLEINQPQVVTAKCSEPQAVDSDVMGEGSGVAILLSARTETWWGQMVDEIALQIEVQKVNVKPRQ